MDTPCLDLDLHRLELRFAGARLVEPRAVEGIARSIERGGQIVPCIAVADPPVEPGEGGGRLVLIDGYRRVAALRQLGRDTARVECWPCDLAEALLGLLARNQSRLFAAIEEALLLRELVQGLGLSQHEVARRSGRDASWVSRRLQLVLALPDAALVAVREGWLSNWAASRVVVPLARANAEHADRLLQALSDAPLSTRELGCWFEHYQRTNRATRERLVSHPQLFVQAVQERADQRLGARLRERLPSLRPLPAGLVNAVPRLRTNFDALCNEINWYAEKDSDRDPQQCASSQGAGSEPVRDQPSAE